MIVATGVYALLLKFLQKNSQHNVQTKGGGVKGFLNNVQKNCTFLIRWLPLVQKNLTDQRFKSKATIPFTIVCASPNFNTLDLISLNGPQQHLKF